MALRNVGIIPTFDDWYRYVSIIDPAEILEMWSTSRNGKKTHHQKLEAEGCMVLEEFRFV